MDKADIARHIHQQAGISKNEAARLLDQILALLKTTLQAGEPITIQGFGKFAVRSKQPRQGRNPIAKYMAFPDSNTPRESSMRLWIPHPPCFRCGVPAGSTQFRSRSSDSSPSNL